MRRFAAALLSASLNCTTLANEAVPAAADPALEARVMQVAAELRCLVCQNQTIADSSADLAVDLRKQIREKLRQGQSERQILDFMSERFGDFVHYRPPLKATTLLLWGGPFALLLTAAFVLARTLRQRQRERPEISLTDPERLRAQRLLAGDDK